MVRELAMDSPTMFIGHIFEGVVMPAKRSSRCQNVGAILRAHTASLDEAGALIECDTTLPSVQLGRGCPPPCPYRGISLKKFFDKQIVHEALHNWNLIPN
jgi:hypothetical protein